MKTIIALCAAAVVLTAAGCSQKATADAAAPEHMKEAVLYGDDSGGAKSVYAAASTVEVAAYRDEAAAQAFDAATDSNRKLVVTAHLRIRLSDLKKSETELNNILSAYNAYAASTSVQENRQRYTIRVPADLYTLCLEELKRLGSLLSYSEETDDVTVQYYDLESRLTTVRELLKTFQAYLGKAATIDEIMTVERRIAELQREIDATGSQFRALSNQIEYSTIELELRGPEYAQTYNKPAIGERIAGLFSTFTDYASLVVLVLLGVVIYGTPSVLMAALLYWLLLGKIGVLKKLWRLAGGKKQ
jgi:hypothetical protein